MVIGDNQFRWEPGEHDRCRRHRWWQRRMRLASINGGNVDNSTNLTIDAGGGTAIGDVSGGNGNLAPPA